MIPAVHSLAAQLATETTALGVIAAKALAGDVLAAGIVADYAADLAAEGGDHNPAAA